MLSRLFNELFRSRSTASARRENSAAIDATPRQGVLEARRESRSGTDSRRYSEVLEALLNNREHSSAQLLQDIFALYFSGFKKHGYFVEFGATDGVALSNTYSLEKRFNWNGIVAEPLPTWHAALEANRTCHIDKRCVYSRSGRTMTFVDTVDYPELSGLQQDLPKDMNEAGRTNRRTFDVQTVSLSELLETYSAPRKIDYLSVDTEGSELEILSAFDFSKYAVSVVTVEHNFVQAQRAAIQSVLEKAGFARLCEPISRWDDWYVHRDNPVSAKFTSA